MDSITKFTKRLFSSTNISDYAGRYIHDLADNSFSHYFELQKNHKYALPNFLRFSVGRTSPENTIVFYIKVANDVIERNTLVSCFTYINNSHCNEFTRIKSKDETWLVMRGTILDEEFNVMLMPYVIIEDGTITELKLYISSKIFTTYANTQLARAIKNKIIPGILEEPPLIRGMLSVLKCKIVIDDEPECPLHKIQSPNSNVLTDETIRKLAIETFK